jgi:C1A family cysteine protease
MIAADDKVIYKKFQEFLQKYGKTYSSIEEYQMRYKIFTASLMEVVAADDFLGNKHTKSITKFSDMTKDEFKAQYLTLKMDKSNGWCDSVKVQKSFKATPAEKDWRTEGKVSPIKDQGQCGSCWAFSTIAFLESQNLINGAKVATFSEQQLVDCDTASTNQGCNGGLMHTALAYIQANGIEDDGHYKYTASDDTCAYNKKFVIKNKVSAVQCMEAVDDDTIKQHLNEVGPLSIAVAADDFQSYDSGVLDCNYTQLDHGVLLVGYGTEDGKDYWIIKNSWGANWGEKGFVRVSQTAGANCGVGTYIATATLSK